MHYTVACHMDQGTHVADSMGKWPVSCDTYTLLIEASETSG